MIIDLWFLVVGIAFTWIGFLIASLIRDLWRDDL